MNENSISVQHDTHYVSTLNWTYYGLFQTSLSSICVQFTDFGFQFSHILYHNLALGLMPADEANHFHISWTKWRDNLFIGRLTTWRRSFCVF